MLPALAARCGPPRWSLAIGYTAAAVGYIAGLLLSAVADLPSGPTIVLALLATFLGIAAARGSFHRTVT
jgi:ABC-type Mn2+/Zn2+ transport system permease subunit